MDRINWNSKLVILVKHIIFTTPFIADGSGLCAFWTDLQEPKRLEHEEMVEKRQQHRAKEKNLVDNMLLVVC